MDALYGESGEEPSVGDEVQFEGTGKIGVINEDGTLNISVETVGGEDVIDKNYGDEDKGDEDKGDEDKKEMTDEEMEKVLILEIGGGKDNG